MASNVSGYLKTWLPFDGAVGEVYVGGAMSLEADSETFKDLYHFKFTFFPTCGLRCEL